MRWYSEPLKANTRLYSKQVELTRFQNSCRQLTVLLLVESFTGGTRFLSAIAAWLEPLRRAWRGWGSVKALE